ncbi:hypothetical protein C483_02246 [Natrialba hulunbeirensis JCM 10989]|uniref:Uncharacterized protein n=1 Tax=Natrialba hulunbeirensis JCM 10989 TaxID=1227493 RepID=M0ABA3_9EURY|nr:helix-hairpin-helix domain-containing protein [Natrialba hulunbeirensis]ELY95147.1 hypothetical protein C483_02246 [Natrialba hulunbeirensis JCM 10989]
MNIIHQIKAGQVYRDSRNGNELHLVYLDSQHILLKDDENYARLMTRRDFGTSVGAGRFSVVGNAPVIAETAYKAIDLERIDDDGAKTARVLQAQGHTTAEYIQQAGHSELLDVPGIGEKNIEIMINRAGE